MSNEADTCRVYVRPKLKESGWDDSPHSYTEQHTFTDGRIMATGARVRRGPQKRAETIIAVQKKLCTLLGLPSEPDETA